MLLFKCFFKLLSRLCFPYLLLKIRFFYWLKRTGYRGYLVIDQFPYREDGRDAVAESAEWLDVLQEAAARIDEEQAKKVLAARDGVEASRFMRKVLFGK